MGGVRPNASTVRSAPRPPSGLPEVTVAVRIALLPCREPGNREYSRQFGKIGGESQLRCRVYGSTDMKRNP